MTSRSLQESYAQWAAIVSALGKSNPGANWLVYWDDTIADLSNWIQRDMKPAQGNFNTRFVRRIAVLKNRLWYKICFSPSPARFKIWFVPLTLSHLKQMLPVAGKLREAGSPPLFITSKKPILQTLRHHGFDCWVVEDAAEGARKTPFQDAIEQLPEAKTTRVFWQSRWPSIQKWERAMSYLLRQSRPGLLVLGNDLLTYCRLAARLAREQGIPTACIQHGSMNQLNPLHHHIKVDRYFVFGERTAVELQQAGLLPERISISGSPAMGESMSDGSAAGRLNQFFPNGYALVLLSGAGHSTSEHHYRRIIRSVAVVAQRIQPVRLLIKLHPKESKSAYAALAFGAVIWSNADLAAHRFDTLDLIRSAKCLFTGASTAAQEALYFGVPVFSLDFENEYPKADFILAGASIHCSSEDDFFEKTQRFLLSPSAFEAIQNCAKGFAANMYFEPEGRSPAEFTAAEMLKIAHA